MPPAMMAGAPLRPDAAVGGANPVRRGRRRVDISATHVPVEHHRERIIVVPLRL